jgi:hypothetical protein
VAPREFFKLFFEASFRESKCERLVCARWKFKNPFFLTFRILFKTLLSWERGFRG